MLTSHGRGIDGTKSSLNSDSCDLLAYFFEWSNELVGALESPNEEGQVRPRERGSNTPKLALIAGHEMSFDIREC
jgi:hypothetical protein